MRRSNFALRLQPSLLEELRKAAEVEGVALNQLINVAVAEKVSALRTEEYFRERNRRADRAETLRILERAGQGNPPMEGDELPPEWRKKPGRKAANERDSAKRGQKKRAATEKRRGCFCATHLGLTSRFRGGKNSYWVSLASTFWWYSSTASFHS